MHLLFQDDIVDDALTRTSAHAFSKRTIAFEHMRALMDNDDTTCDSDVDSVDENNEARRLSLEADNEPDDDDDTESEGQELDEVEENHHIVVHTEAEFLQKGLEIIGCTERRIRRGTKAKNKERFGAHFGSNPIACLRIWEDPQTAEINKAWVAPSKRNLKHFLMAVHFPKRCPAEIEREAIFDVSPQHGREWIWHHCEKIQALKAVEIKWPDVKDVEGEIWTLAADGTHCWMNEKSHPDWSQDSEWCSHKFGKAGVNYELGILLFESRLIWMNGPFKAGQNDKKIFAEQGLKAKLKALKQKATGDSGCTGHFNECSIPNPQDDDEVARFKSRALKRHERFNGCTKAFGCLSGRFCHSVKRFETCFEAVCVICQHQMENGSELHDILLEDMVHEQFETVLFGDL